MITLVLVYDTELKTVLFDPRGGTPLYGLYRYVPRNKVGFLEVLDP